MSTSWGYCAGGERMYLEHSAEYGTHRKGFLAAVVIIIATVTITTTAVITDCGHLSYFQRLQGREAHSSHWHFHSSVL